MFQRFGPMLLATLLVAGLITPGAQAQTAEEPPLDSRPTIAGPYTGCGAGMVDEAGDMVTFSGAATAGSSISDAVIRQFDSHDVPVTNLDRHLPLTGTDRKISIAANGNFSGSVALQSLNSATQFVRLLVTVTKDTRSVTGASNPLSLERSFPEIKSYTITSPKTIQVLFTESVFAPNRDSTIDWFLGAEESARKPSSVTGADDIRVLRFDAENFGKNQTDLDVHYRTYPGRLPYQDCVDHELIGERVMNAQDGILPPVPVLASIEGSDAADRMTAGRSSTPVVRIDGVEAEGRGQLWRETNGVAGLQTGETGDTKMGSAPESNGVASITSENIGAGDRLHTFYVRALDKNDNASSGYDESAYRVDTVAPRFVGSTNSDRTVVVTFDEPIYGPNDPTHWTVSSPDIVGPSPYTVTRVEGSESARTLTLSAVPRNVQVSYRAPESARYRDEAGNLLPEFGTTPAQGGASATTLDLSPETALLAVNGKHIVTINVNAGSGIVVPGTQVALRAISGPSSTRDVDQNATTAPGVIGTCMTDANGVCKFEFSSPNRGVDVLQAWIGDAGSPPALAEDSAGTDIADQDMGQIEWTLEGTDLVIDASPEDSSGPTNQPQSILIDVAMVGEGTSGLPVGGVNVDVRVLDGPNAGKHDECDTKSDGKCSIPLSSSAMGTDQVQVWIDRDEDDTTTGELFCRRFAMRTTCTDQNEAATPSGSLGEDAAQDVVVQRWMGQAVPILQVEPETSTGASGTARSFTLGVTSTQSPNGVEGVNVDARVASGPNAGLSLGECSTNTQGRCTVTYNSRFSGTDSIQGWIDLNDDDIANEAEQFESRDESTGTDEADQDVVQASWTGGSTPTPTTTPSPGSTPSPGPTDPGTVGARSATISASARKVAFREPVTFSGIVSGSDECLNGVVLLQRKRGNGDFATRRQVDAVNGDWSTTMRPFKSATYRAVVPATSSCSNATSSSVGLLVAAKVIAKANVVSQDGATCLSISGRVAPAKPGSTVQLQRSGSNGWNIVGRSVLSKRSKYRFVRCDVKNRYRFRVIWFGDSSNEPASSPILRGRVN
jgi:hypothetical protein